MFATTLVSLLLFVINAFVVCHGFVQQVRLGNALVDAWNPFKDPQKKPAVNRITRKFKDNGPVTDGKFLVWQTYRTILRFNA
jgi:hypothetical protein